MSTVSVKIFGQDYNITAGKSEDYIKRVAEHVDSSMRAISNGRVYQPLSLAVLTAVNIADEYYETLAKIESMERISREHENEMQNYSRLWEEAKETAVRQKEQQAESAEREKALRELIAGRDARIATLESELRQVRNALAKANSAAENMAAEANAEADKRVKELEASFFDLQMENIQMKSTIEKLKKQLSE